MENEQNGFFLVKEEILPEAIKKTIRVKEMLKRGEIIKLSPIGVACLICPVVAENGPKILSSLLTVLLVAYGGYIIHAAVVYSSTVKVLAGISPVQFFKGMAPAMMMAFSSASSVGALPFNMECTERLGARREVSSFVLPLGATINMAGASITISVLALAAAHTLGLAIDLPTAFLLCIVSSVGACGTSGVAGGSLLLIPVACASFGIGNDISMQVVGVGFIISVLEDACETALNSSSDVLFTATAEFAERRKEGTFHKEDMVPHDAAE